MLKSVAGKAVPILLTILSTCFGLVPFIIEGQGEIFWFSLAIGTIGGLLFSMVGVFLALPVFLWKKRYDNSEWGQFCYFIYFLLSRVWDA